MLPEASSISKPEVTVFAVDYKWVCLRHFVIESAYDPSSNDLQKICATNDGNSDTRQGKTY